VESSVVRHGRRKSNYGRVDTCFWRGAKTDVVLDIRKRGLLLVFGHRFSIASIFPLSLPPEVQLAYTFVTFLHRENQVLHDSKRVGGSMNDRTLGSVGRR
jgi:hypothetical protein